MASPFSQTMESRRTDFFYTGIAVMVIAVILALLWGDWFFNSPILTYEISKTVHITNRELIREQFIEASGGPVYTQAFRKRLVIAEFEPGVLERIEPGQAAYVHIKDQEDHTVKVPATVIEVSNPTNGKKGQVTLEAEVPENLPNPFEKGSGEQVRIEAENLTPAKLAFQASGLGVDTPPVTLSPRSADK
jgi:hypothetical protein